MWRKWKAVQCQRGQSTVEWTVLVLLVATLLTTLVVVVDMSWLPRRLGCVISAGCHSNRSALEAAYGKETAYLVRANAPMLAYMRNMLSLPVDFRKCQEHFCSDAASSPEHTLQTARGGHEATAFTHVVDQRADGGDLFLQYWFYYPDSRLQHTGQLGQYKLAGYHLHDWESYQVRIKPDGSVYARASAHHGYSEKDKHLQTNEVNDSMRHAICTSLHKSLPAARVLTARDEDVNASFESCNQKTGGWSKSTMWMRVTRGSHAGDIVDGRRQGNDGERWTSGDLINLVPLENRSADEWDSDYNFGEITPPWRKGVYGEPESFDT